MHRTKEEQSKYNREQYVRHRSKILVRSKEYHNKKREEPDHKLKIKAGLLKRQYGITLEDYNQMFLDQDGCCAICKKHQSEFKLALCVDHCHLTGEVRGLLCTNCNVVLGNAKDNIEVLKEAIKYLECH